MEKIYMEENKKQKRGKQRQQSVDFSVVLSFVVAIFAIVSIGAFAIASNQGNNVSYAAPTPDTFSMVMFNTDDETHYSGVGGTSAGAGDYFYTPFYYAGSESEANRIFCIEHGVTATNGSGYEKGELINDNGLMYILTHSYANGVSVLNLDNTYTDEEKKYAEIYATQAAIWLYLHETSSDPNNKLDNPTIGHDSTAVLATATDFTVYGNASDLDTITFSVSDMYAKIRALVDTAKTAPERTVVISKESDDFVKTEDGKYYQTALMTVSGNPAADFKSYDINLGGIDGAVAINENGDVLNLQGVAPGTKFFVRIPVDKINKQTTTLTIGVIGHFDSLAGYQYVSTDRQTVVVVSDEDAQAEAGTSVEIAGVPDTGMNTAQTIYFIGLIVLLCGVGIVYANAKPVESKQ